MTSQLVVDAQMVAVWRWGKPVVLLLYSNQGQSTKPKSVSTQPAAPQTNPQPRKVRASALVKMSGADWACVPSGGPKQALVGAICRRL